MEKLIDKFNRKIDYLRISVTDRCNLRCVYCMPVNGILHKPQQQILSFEQIYRIVHCAVRLGIRKVRITGGEPLVRKDLHLLIKKLKCISALKEISLTTNGIYLSKYVHSLRMAGLDRINISLDTLIPEKFRQITRGGDLEEVLKGLERAFFVGLSPVKINTVLMRGFNDDEILNFAKLTQNRPLHIRFIEYMSTSLDYESSGSLFFSCAEAKKVCCNLGKLLPVSEELGGTASVFRIEGFYGTLGFISPISEPFCSSCNKLRLTSDGHLRSCLHSSKSINLKAALDIGMGEQDLSVLIKEAVALKPKSHNLLNVPLGLDSKDFSMCQIGG